MRRTITALAALLVLAFTASAIASPAPPPGEPTNPATPTSAGMPAGPGDPSGGPWSGHDGRTIHMFRGEVVAVDPAARTVEADAEYLNGPDAGVFPPAPSRMTFRVDDDTTVYRDGRKAALEDLRAGDLLHVAILADRDASLEEVLATPAFVMSAAQRPEFFGFGGRVTAVDAERGAISLRVKYATPAARRLIGDGEPPVLTFATNADTDVIVDGERGSLERLGAGDLAGVGVIGHRRSTLAEVLATPARMVIGLTEARPTDRRYARLARRAAGRSRAHR